MKRIAVYTTLIIFILLSCAKDGKRIFVEGKVLNPITGEGIEGIRIKVMKNALDGGFKVLEETYTDDNGNYEIGVNSLALDVYVRCDGDFGLHIVGWNLDFEAEFIDLVTFRIPKKGKVYQADYHTVPEGELIVKVKNINCFDQNDRIELFYDGSQLGYDNILIGKFNELDGCTDTSSGSIEYPSGYRYYHYTFTKNNITETKYDSVNVLPNNTTFFEINY